MKIPPLDEYSQPLSFRLPPEEHSFRWKSVFENVFGESIHERSAVPASDSLRSQKPHVLFMLPRPRRL